MAPRAESTPRKDRPGDHGARNRPYLNAHTGAGVHASRSSLLRGRDSSRNRGTRRPGYRGDRSSNRRRALISPLGGRRAEDLTSPDDQRSSSHLQADRGSDAVLPTHQHDDEKHTSSRMTTHEPTDSIFTRNTVVPMTSYITTNPRPPSPSPNTFLHHHHRNDNPSPNLTYRIPPPPKKLTPKPRNDDEAVKKAFTNPILRAIMSGKPWPAQRKKPSAERPILKMGMKKEYK